MLKKICVSVISVLIAIVLFVIVEIIFFPTKDIFLVNSKIMEQDDNNILQYSLIKNSYLFNCSINEEGFRGSNKINRDKSIVILGDSVGFGYDRENTDKTVFSYILQEYLAKDYDVFNLSVPGYNTIQEAEVLYSKGLKYKPDLVLVIFCLNDLDVNYTITHYNNFISKKLIRSRIFRYIFDLFRSKNCAKNYRKYGKIDVSDVENEEIGIKVISVLQKKYGFQCYFFIVPYFRNFDDYLQEDDNIHVKIKEFLQKYPNLKFFDLKEDFMNISKNAKIFSVPNDIVHPNKYGHKLMAEFICEKLKKDGALS